MLVKCPLHKLISFSAWKNENDPQKASRMFCEELLCLSEHCPSLSLLFNQFDTVEEQDSSLISFYKMNSANWSAPFKCRLAGITVIIKNIILGNFCTICVMYISLLFFCWSHFRRCSCWQRSQSSYFVNDDAKIEDWLRFKFGFVISWHSFPHTPIHFIDIVITFSTHSDG